MTKLHRSITLTEDTGMMMHRVADAASDIATDINTLLAMVKQMDGPPNDATLKLVWQAHEKLGDVYALVEQKRRDAK